jgi:adenine deaminase
VIASEETSELNILIEGEKVAAMVDPKISVKADKVVDASGQIILPGAIDGHTHFCPINPLENHPCSSPRGDGCRGHGGWRTFGNRQDR